MIFENFVNKMINDQSVVHRTFKIKLFFFYHSDQGIVSPRKSKKIIYDLRSGVELLKNVQC